MEIVYIRRFLISPESLPNVFPDPLLSDADLLLKSCFNLQANVSVLPEGNTNLLSPRVT